jgi:hypothetical protein
VVSQGSGCTFSISPTSQHLPYFGGSGSVAVATSPGCTWAATSSIPWVRFTSGQSGTGPGPAVFTADETPSSLPRSATVSVAGLPFAITQDGGPCTFVLSPPSAALGAGGGSGTFEVNTKDGGPWTATSNDAGLRVTAGGEWVRRRHGELQCRRQPWHGPDGDDRRGRPAIHGITGGSWCDDCRRAALVGSIRPSLERAAVMEFGQGSPLTRFRHDGRL